MIYKVFISGNYLVLEDETGNVINGLAKDVLVSENGSLIGFSGMANFNSSKRIALGNLTDESGAEFTLESFREFYRNQTGSAGSSGETEEPQQPDMEPPTTPEDVVVSNITDNSATVSWVPSTDDVGVASYVVYLDGDEVGNPGATNFELIELGSETIFGVQVSAVDWSGKESSMSETVSFTTLAS